MVGDLAFEARIQLQPVWIDKGLILAMIEVD